MLHGGLRLGVLDYPEGFGLLHSDQARGRSDQERASGHEASLIPGEPLEESFSRLVRPVPIQMLAMLRKSFARTVGGEPDVLGALPQPLQLLDGRVRVVALPDSG
ncbi:hypothetical protein FXF65_40450 [Actinomadura syzygii]|uniref:Uncharacterized protein n=1 Tax=Actinomadura syzygii TaxID=1427538 RepID=A0A5D0TSD8_9ACTN|nr:hypothetical protein FXF65_40450 [Actinomadura syzygii]